MVGAMPATAMAMASQVPAPWNRMADGSTGARGFVESIPITRREKWASPQTLAASIVPLTDASTDGRQIAVGRDILAGQKVKPVAVQPGYKKPGATSMHTEREYWFPAKRYGWGWGIPTTWQGWLVLAAFAVLLIVGSIMVPPGKQIWSYLAYVAVLCVLLTGICWLKGEPPRWRWGKD